MDKKTYAVYKARMEYHKFNDFIGKFEGYSVDQVKKQLKDENIINPFYTVIVDITNGAKIIEHNKHLPFVGEKKDNHF